MTGPPGTVPHEVPGSRSDSAATHVEERKEPARTRVRFPAPPQSARRPHDIVRMAGLCVPRPQRCGGKRGVPSAEQTAQSAPTAPVRPGPCWRGGATVLGGQHRATLVTWRITRTSKSACARPWRPRRVSRVPPRPADHRQAMARCRSTRIVPAESGSSDVSRAECRSVRCRGEEQVHDITALGDCSPFVMGGRPRHRSLDGASPKARMCVECLNDPFDVVMPVRCNVP